MSVLDQRGANPQPARLIIAAVAVTLLLASLGQTIVTTALPVVGESWIGPVVASAIKE